ncbi:MAG: tetratricopeptide repeat protein [bacterium]|nr:tetratricopeptide repeat protein [bacterium]
MPQSPTAAKPLIANRYHIVRQIGQGGMGAVYQVDDRLNSSTVALKRVKVGAHQLQFNSRDTTGNHPLIALASEFRTLAGLRHPNIVTVVDYGFDLFGEDGTRSPFYTMQYYDNAQTLTDYGKALDTKGKVGLLVQALQALAYLHRRGVIHRDIKPGNVLVTDEGETPVVHVTDFGLALNQTETVSSVYTGAVGTMLYMAPELYAEEPASFQSDLYALGMMAYELFVGGHPFPTKNLAALVRNILGTKPDTAALPPALAAVLDRLLEKEATARYPDADSVITALCEATSVPLPAESALLRESYLQAARFVGRDKELDTLKAALSRVVGAAQNPAESGEGEPIGSAWLVGGESGVGKSRLMEELRIRALVDGALVLRGQAVEGGGLPYQLWRDVVRRLALSVHVSDLEAAILKEIVPDIDRLLNRAIEAAPALTGDAARQRLVATIATLIQRCCEGHRPLLLILEDLQWSAESLEPLKVLNRLVADLPLLIVGSYRDDERPTLPKELPAIKSMTLARLDDKAIADLSEAMLGEAGAQLNVVNLLRRETEGNVYFLVETVRALAEDAGRLSEIGKNALPDKVFAGGVQQVAQRRLARVPAEARDLLTLAAVAGRQLDLGVLRRSKPDISLEDWLTTCANAAVLEQTDGQWRFAHDKLREAALAELPQPTRAALHQQVAEALESLYPGDDARADQLMEHWRAADEPAKEVGYIVTVGRLYTEFTANYRSAREILERGLKLAETLPDGKHQQMRMYYYMGKACEQLGDFPTADESGRKSFELAEQLNDAKGRADAVYAQTTAAIFGGDINKAVEFGKRSLVLYGEIDDKLGVSATLLVLGAICYRMGDFGTARSYLDQSIALAVRIGDLQRQGGALLNLGAVELGMGNLSAARDRMAEALAIARQIGDRRSMALGINNLGALAMNEEDYEAARSYLTESLSLARESGNQQVMANSLGNLGSVAYYTGDFHAASAYYEKSLRIFRDIGMLPGVAAVANNLAFAYLTLHEMDAARKALAEGLKIAHETNATPVLMESLVGCARLRYLEDRFEPSAELAGLVRDQPETNAETFSRRLEPLEADLKKLMGEAAFEQAADRGKALDVSATVEGLLTELAKTVKA